MCVSHTEAAVNPFTLHSISIFHPMQTEDVGYDRIRAKLNINNLRSTSPRNQKLVPKHSKSLTFFGFHLDHDIGIPHPTFRNTVTNIKCHYNIAGTESFRISLKVCGFIDKITHKLRCMCNSH